MNISPIPYFLNSDLALYVGDAQETLQGFREASVDCVVTSPPYYGLRDYGTGEWIGGNPLCDHIKVSGGTKSSKLGAAFYDNGMSDRAIESSILASFIQYGRKCKKCGAQRIDKQIGLEETKEEYIKKLVSVFKEIKRILKPEGTVFLNISDKYDKKKLLGIPWRVAFALEEDGWYICSDIIWNKLNPMPSSVKTRPTRSHEYIFLLTKSLNYYWDYETALEPAKWERWGKQTTKKKAGTSTMVEERTKEEINKKFNTKKRNMRSVWTFATGAYSDAHFAVFPQELPEKAIPAGCPPGGVILDPFIGSGTTALVAKKLGRKCVGIELSEDNANLCLKRLELLNDAC